MTWRKKFLKFIDRIKLQILLNIRRNALVSVILSLFILVVVTGYAIKNIEQDDAYNSIWRSIVYVFSGIDVDPPKTVTGKALASVILLVGAIFVSILTAFVYSSFNLILSSSNIVKTKRPKSVFNNHVIIFGWCNRSRELLRELNDDFKNGYLGAQEFLIVSEDESIEKGSETIFDVVYHLKGKFSDPDLLKRSDLQPGGRKKGARVAVIFPNRILPPQEADRQSLLSLLAIEHMYPEVISVVESCSADSEEHFRNAYADEVIVPSTYSVNLLARTAEFPGTYTFISDVLSLRQNAENPPATICHVPASDLHVAGMTLRNAVTSLFDSGRGIAIGLLRNGSLELISEMAGLLEVVISPEHSLVMMANAAQINDY
jgi:hypothetical protein